MSFTVPAIAATNNLLADVQKTAIATNLGLFGGPPNDIAIDPNDDAYVYAAISGPNGIFHSSDGGETWQGLPNDTNFGAAYAVEVDPATGDVYALIGDDLLKSTDHGENWEVMELDLGSALLSEAMFISDTRLHVALTGGGILSMTMDQSAAVIVDLSEEQSGVYVTSFAVAQDGAAYAVLNDADTSYLFTSTDDGSTWTTMDVTSAGVATGDRFYTILVDPTNNDHLVLVSYDPESASYHTLDGGVAWLELTNGENRIGSTIGAFDTNGRLYISQYYSDNAQSETPTWTEMATETPNSRVSADRIFIDPTDETVLFSNTPYGVAKSTDSGSSWVDVVEGITQVKTYSISQAENKDVVWIAANGGLAHTTNFTDDAPDWEYPVLPDGSSTPTSMFVDPNDNDTLIAGMSAVIYRSTDGGSTWVAAETPEFSGQVLEIMPSRVDKNTFYAVFMNGSISLDDTGGVLESTDSGATWVSLNLTDDLPATALAVGDNDTLFVGIGGDAQPTGVYTFDGDEWTKLEENFNNIVINDILVDPNDSQTMFITAEAESTEGSLYKSTDGGSTWSTISDGLEQVNHLDTIVADADSSPTTLYMAGQDDDSGNGVIYKSSDAGESWGVYYTGLKQEFFYALLFDALTFGNDRGVFNAHSLGKLTVKKHSQRVLAVTLKDATTNIALDQRVVGIYKKKLGKWKLVNTVKTNANGKVQIQFAVGTRGKYRAVWKPAKKDRAEYTRTHSRTVTFK
ncbi:MAG: hypothetical protein HYV32_05850 [Candidatus Kerfeldbacteria bacterium]|nr:hypothetical protein [Candidatus Kerfeldbacteria bacterium]